MHLQENIRLSCLSAIRMARLRMSRQKPVIQTLLPLQKPESDDAKSKGAAVEYDFSPEPAKLLAELLPVTVKTRLFQAFNEAIVSEHIARMIAGDVALGDVRDLMGEHARDF